MTNWLVFRCCYCNNGLYCFWRSSDAIAIMAYIVVVVPVFLLQQWFILLLVFQCCYCNNGLYFCWCSSVAIATVAYFIAVGVLCKNFPHYMTCITGWSYSHKSNYYVWIV